MKLIPQKDDMTNRYFAVLGSEAGQYRMALHPVMFGWRVRGWAVQDFGCTIDWCGGDDPVAVRLLYSFLKNILESRPENEHVFDGLPGASKIKPFTQDAEFVSTILSKLTVPFDLVEIPDLAELRTRQ